MKKIMLFLSPLIAALIVFGAFIYFLNKEEGKGALQVTSLPKSKVYLNGKLIGETPLCKCTASDMLGIGEYTVRLVPQEAELLPYEDKIIITKSVLTVVDRTFGKDALSDGSIITLVPLDNANNMELLVLSFPEDVEVSLDSAAVKNTPALLKNITESDHEIKLKKQGYKEKTIRIRTVKGYKLTVIAALGSDPNAFSEINNKDASASAQLQTPSGTTSAVVKIVILETPTGFLRVREKGSTNSLEIARVKPKETFELVEEKDGWFAIKLENGKVGWITSQYANKQ